MLSNCMIAIKGFAIHAEEVTTAALPALKAGKAAGFLNRQRTLLFFTALKAMRSHMRMMHREYRNGYDDFGQVQQLQLKVMCGFFDSIAATRQQE